jgi:hypothetical protein
MVVVSPTKQHRPPPSHKAANADLCQEVLRAWRKCGRNTREAVSLEARHERGGVRHYLDQAREEWKATAGASFGDAAHEAEFLIRDVYETASERSPADGLGSRQGRRPSIPGNLPPLPRRPSAAPRARRARPPGGRHHAVKPAAGTHARAPIAGGRPAPPGHARAREGPPAMG